MGRSGAKAGNLGAGRHRSTYQDTAEIASCYLVIRAVTTQRLSAGADGVSAFR